MRAEERERRRFSEILAQDLGDPRLRAMMSMRADFFGDLQKDEPLYSVHRLINVPPLREAQLREVVSRPAALLSARFETPGLAASIAQRAAEEFDKGCRRAAAPLLSARRHVDQDGAPRRRRAPTAGAGDRARRRAGRPRRCLPRRPSDIRGRAPPRPYSRACHRARGRGADAAARTSFRTLGRGMAAGQRTCRLPESATRHGHTRGRRDLCGGRARSDLPALGEVARTGSLRSEYSWPGKPASKPRAAPGRQHPTVRRATRC